MNIYIPESFKKRKTSGYAELPYYLKRDVANINALKKLEEEGLLEDFLKYRKKRSVLDIVKKTGSGALDILQRGEYATAGATEEVWGGEPGITGREAVQAVKRAGRELFSGIGGIKGEKKVWGDVIRKNVPEYDAWTQEHPFLSMASDLAFSIGLDPTTYAGGVLVRGLGRGIKTTAKTAGATKTAQRISKAISPITEPVKELAGRVFVPGHLWKKAGVPSGYDILQSEKDFAKGLRNKLSNKINPAVEEIATWEPEKIKNFVKVMYGDIPIESVSDDISRVATGLKKTLTQIGRKESKYMGKGTEWMLENYFPNNPRQFTELMENVGEYLPSGHNRGLALWKTTSDRQKVLRTGEDFLNWLGVVGVKDENLGDVVIKNLIGRSAQSVAKVRKIRIHHKLVRDLPEVFEEVPYGTKKVWSLAKEGEPIVRPGNTLWMPYGNLKFFPSDVIRKNKKLSEALANKTGISLTADELTELSSKIVGVTTRVKAYQVPIEIVEDIDNISKRLVDETGIWETWDKFLMLWKNLAILSPFFHNRNFVTSGVQSYVAGINPSRFYDGWRYMYNKWQGKTGVKVLNRTVGAWDEMFSRHGIWGGSFVGQQVGKTEMLGKTAEKVFKFNREVIGRNIEQFHRTSLFMDSIQKGKKPIEAAKIVKKFHFDYSELTNFERDVMRRVMPFYAWTRKNVPLQLEMLFKAPQKYQQIAKLKRAIAGAPESEYNPDWWREQDVWETKFGYGVHVGLPYADLNQWMTNLTSTTGPFGMVGNVARGYDPFYQEKIQQFKGEKKPMFMGKYLRFNPYAKYVIENAVPIIKRYGTDFSEELYNLFSGNDPDEENKYKVIKKITGVGILPKVKTREEKTRIYRLMDELDNYMKYREQEGY